jgi:hypothetical protein
MIFSKTIILFELSTSMGVYNTPIALNLSDSMLSDINGLSFFEPTLRLNYMPRNFFTVLVNNIFMIKNKGLSLPSKN